MVTTEHKRRVLRHLLATAPAALFPRMFVRGGVLVHQERADAPPVVLSTSQAGKLLGLAP